MNRFKKWQVFIAALVLAGGGLAAQTASAQVPDAQGPGRIGGPGQALVCSTTNYTDVAAQALGMNSTDLRVALVSGKSISTIASGKNVSLQTVADALNTARKADIAQAVKDGLLTQAQADAIIARMTAVNPAQGGAGPATPPANMTPPATPPALGSGPNAGPRLPGLLGGFGRGFGLGIPAYNVVNREVVAAQALGMTCPDLVKATQSGQSIAQIATSKNVQLQTVIDALVNAYKAAYAQDVKEGLITQAQADGRITELVQEITRFVNNARSAAPFGGGRQPGPRGPGRGNAQPATPPAGQPTA